MRETGGNEKRFYRQIQMKKVGQNSTQKER